MKLFNKAIACFFFFLNVQIQAILFVKLIKSMQLLMNGLRVKVLLLRFQFICTKTIRRLDPLRVNIVNNTKGQQPRLTAPSSCIFLQKTGQKNHIQQENQKKRDNGVLEANKKRLPQDCCHLAA